MKTKLDGLNNPINPDGEYYVQDARPKRIVGNCLLLWGIKGAGYTCDLDKAGVYPGHEVLNMRDPVVPWPKDVIEKTAIRHVRIEPLQRLRDGEN